MATAKVPPTLKSIGHYIKIANENAARDPVIYYWCLYYAVQTGMQVDRTSKDALAFLTSLLSTLETIKKQLSHNEAVTNEVIAQAHIEGFATKLFTYADTKEKTGDVNKTVMHAFYTAGHVLDVLSLFGEMDESLAAMKKYAKWKSTQIFTHLRDGTPYVPSSAGGGESAEDAALGFGSMSFRDEAAASNGMGGGSPFQQPYPPPGGPSEHSYHSASFPSLPSDHSSPSPFPSYPSAHGSFPSQPHQQPPAYQQYQDPAPSRPLPPAPGPSKAKKGEPNMDDFNECKRYTKYALSAIDYEDVTTIIDNLKKALAIVEKFQ